MALLSDYYDRENCWQSFHNVFIAEELGFAKSLHFAGNELVEMKLQIPIQVYAVLLQL